MSRHRDKKDVSPFFPPAMLHSGRAAALVACAGAAAAFSAPTMSMDPSMDRRPFIGIGLAAAASTPLLRQPATAEAACTDQSIPIACSPGPEGSKNCAPVVRTDSIIPLSYCRLCPSACSASVCSASRAMGAAVPQQ